LIVAALLLAALAFGPSSADSSGNPGAPVYSADSIANSAASIAGFYAPNTFISIYGQNLATVTKPLADVGSGPLPVTLGGVVVLVNGLPANLWYVSPTLVNVLIPSYLVAGPATVQVVANGYAGLPVTLQLTATAPAIFPADATTVIATFLDGTLVTATAPARGGDWVVLWAGGLGPTNPPAVPNQLETIAARLAAPIQVLLNGVAVDPSRINYAGATPGYAGLFQINVLLPDDTPANPEIRVATTDQISPAQRYLPVQ
jgi:uncharacterized protein (TIGR03437 family)